MSSSFVILGLSTNAFAQTPAPEEDADVEVQATVAAAPSAPAATPSPSAAPAPSAPVASEPAKSPAPAEAKDVAPIQSEKGAKEEVSKKTESESVIQAQLADKDDKATRALSAEGSNYTRPLRPGFRIWGFVQAQYQLNEISENQLDQDGNPINQDQFALRRGRLRAENVWDYASAVLELDATTVNGPRVGIRRAEASLFYRGPNDVAVTPVVVGTLGVTDLPFGLEIGESQRDRLFLERSIGSRALFGTEADLGAKIWGNYRFLNYVVAVVNGEPLDGNGFPRDPNADKDIVGHLGAQARPNEDWLLDLGVSFYQGTGFSAGKPATKDTIVWTDVDGDGVFQAYEIVVVGGAAATPSKNFRRFAFGVDFQTSFRTGLGITKLQAEGIIASNLDRTLIPSDPVTFGADIRQVSLTGALTQQFGSYFAAGFRAAFYDPNSDLVEPRAGVFHLNNQSFLAFSPVLAVTFAHARLAAEYDIIVDHLGRDASGVPSDAKNNQFTLRAQVDL